MEQHHYTGPERRQRKNYRERMVVALSQALFDSDLVSSRITLAIAELAWAIMLFWPGETFNRPTYTMMSHVAPELAWSFIFLITAFFQFTIVALDDYHSVFSRYFAAYNAGMWLFVVGSMLVSVYPPPAAVGGEIALMFTAVWIWLRPFVIAEGLRRVY